MSQALILFKKIKKIKEIAKNYCNACKEFEPQKSKSKIDCIYCTYGNILKIIDEV